VPPIRCITEASEHYPPLLREIAQPPAQLYVRGNLALLQHPRLLAVVGSRKNSLYGQLCVSKLLTPVVQAGIVVVSGLAYGIDSLAHQVAVANHQPTIAVLGSGVDDASLYPRRHIKLVHAIIDQGGAVISEYAPGTPAYLGQFPARNRIIAGLCQATLVVQAADKSGSLITARLALEANRDVCAVPGAITDPLAFGTNSLIEQGAIPALAPANLLHLFGLEESTAAAPLPILTKTQERILRALETAPRHLDTLIETTALPPAVVSRELVHLELLELVATQGGGRYAKV
jgi:DNA processing protein